MIFPYDFKLFSGSTSGYLKISAVIGEKIQVAFRFSSIFQEWFFMWTALCSGAKRKTGKELMACWDLKRGGFLSDQRVTISDCHWGSEAGPKAHWGPKMDIMSGQGYRLTSQDCLHLYWLYTPRLQSLLNSEIPHTPIPTDNKFLMGSCRHYVIDYCAPIMKVISVAWIRISSP